MWREWVARSTAADSEELHFVLIEDIGVTGDANDNNYELMVYRHFLSRDRQHIMSMTFADLTQAHT